MGSRILGMPADMHLPQIAQAFSHAMGDLWHNFRAMFDERTANWGDLARFWRRVMFPYLVGGTILGVGSGAVAYVLSLPLITAYQKRRIRRLKERYERRLAQGVAAARKDPPSD